MAEEKELIDGFFNKGWCCDLDEIYNIVMKMSTLIEKLQKERDIYYYEWKTLEADLINNDIIQKDKIRKKIEELENGEQCYYEFSTGDLVDLLKILLEEE